MAMRELRQKREERRRVEAERRDRHQAGERQRRRADRFDQGGHIADRAAAFLVFFSDVDLDVDRTGGLRGGTVKSAIGIGSLLWFGIGDTIRVSLSAEPEEEVRAGFEILKSLGIRNRGASKCAGEARA